MKIINLHRLPYTENGVFGVFTGANGYPFAVSYERPWILNRSNVSCIPAGEYICRSKVSPNKGFVYELQDVPGRTYIYIHIGNDIGDTKGCILIAEAFEERYNEPFVENSTRAFNQLKNIIEPDAEFILRIHPPLDRIAL